MKITKVYTKTGDEGLTSLVGGYRVSKTNARIEAYGTVDELSANLGVLASYMKDGDDKTLIIRTQRNLFTVCSNLATDKSKMKVATSYTLDPDEVKILEDEIDAINAGIPPQTAFILNESTPVDPEILQYMNRLSDYLFVLARKLNFIDGVREKIWKKPLK